MSAGVVAMWSLVDASVPLLLGAVAIEAFVHWWGPCTRPAEPGGHYAVEDTASSLLQGSAQLFFQKALAPVALYEAAWVAAGQPDPAQLPGWAVLLLVDFVYYWLHRWSHEIGALWWAHAVHHSSEHFNLSTALRQSWLQVLTITVPEVLLLSTVLHWRTALFWQQVHVLYQFWVHTCSIDRLPAWVEAVMVTPSHHRVHHDRRVHKNFGGMFIVYDRLFGTFVPEVAPRPGCVFGTRMPGPGVADVVAQQHYRPRTAKRWWVGPGYHTARAPRRLPPPHSTALRSLGSTATSPEALAAITAVVAVYVVSGMVTRITAVLTLLALHFACTQLALQS